MAQQPLFPDLEVSLRKYTSKDRPSIDTLAGAELQGLGAQSGGRTTALLQERLQTYLQRPAGKNQYYVIEVGTSLQGFAVISASATLELALLHASQASHADQARKLLLQELKKYNTRTSMI